MNNNFSTKQSHSIAVLTALFATLFATSFASKAAANSTSVTIYSSAQPGSLSSDNFSNGNEPRGVPGYAVIKQSREFTLQSGRTIVRVSDVPNYIDPTTVSFT